MCSLAHLPGAGSFHGKMDKRLEPVGRDWELGAGLSVLHLFSSDQCDRSPKKIRNVIVGRFVRISKMKVSETVKCVRCWLEESAKLKCPTSFSRLDISTSGELLFMGSLF